MAELDASQVFDALGTHAGTMTMSVALWACLGVLAGLILSLLACWLLSRLGAFRLAWKHVVWLKVLAILWIVGVCTVLGGVLGFVEGTARGAGAILRDGQFRADVLDPIGRECASGIASIDWLLRKAEADPNATGLEAEDQKQWDAFLERFRAGGEELNVKALIQRAKKVKDTIIDKVARDTLADLRKNGTLKQGSLEDSVLQAILPYAIQWMAGRELEQRLGVEGVIESIKQFVDGMPDAAARAGDPATIAFDELAAHSIDQGVLPLIEYPVRTFTGSMQKIILIPLVVAVLLPIILFALIRRIARPKALAPPPPPA